AAAGPPGRPASGRHWSRSTCVCLRSRRLYLFDLAALSRSAKVPAGAPGGLRGSTPWAAVWLTYEPAADKESLIPKSDHRFSEKIHAQTNGWERDEDHHASAPFGLGPLVLGRSWSGNARHSSGARSITAGAPVSARGTRTARPMAARSH